MTIPQLHDRIATLVDLPALGLKAGAIGTIVDLHPGGAFEVDFGLDPAGDIVTAGLAPDQVTACPQSSRQAA